MGQDNEKTLASGMPDMAGETFSAGKSSVFLALFLTATLGIGTALAMLIFSGSNKEKYIGNLSALPSDAQWLFLSVVVFGRMVAFLNAYPMFFWKGRVMRGKSGNLRANMAIYKCIGDAAPGNAVVLETEGAAGAYNRANRSLTHFTENGLSTVLALLVCGFVAPFPAFLLTSTFSLGRVLHQVGYTTGYGTHAPGFILIAFSSATAEGFSLLCAMQKMGHL